MSASLRALVILLGTVALLASQDRAESQVGSPGQPLAINEILISDPANPGGQFVELLNVTPVPIDLTGWTLQSWRNGLQANLPLSGVVPPQSYFLIANAQFLGPIPPDRIAPPGQLTMAASGGSLVLLQGGVASDTVGWGNTVLGPVEGIPAQSPPPGQSLGRGIPGRDTDNNAVDFQIQPPSPKNSTFSETGNLFPVINPVPPQSVSEGSLLTFTITAFDPEGGPVILESGGLPPGALYDTNTGVFTWVPFYGAALGSPYFISFTATDDVGQLSKTAVQITVVPPVVTVAITSPTSNPTYTTGTSPLALSGTLSNVPAVQSVSWSNAATGGSGIAAGLSPWSAQISLKPGSNAIQVSAIGADGVLGTASILVTYNPPTGGVLLSAPAQVSAKSLTLIVDAEVATSGDVGTVYLGGQLLVLAPDGTVRDNSAIQPAAVSNGAHAVLSYAQKTALSKAKPGDTLLLTATLTGLKTGQVTFKTAETAVVKVVP